MGGTRGVYAVLSMSKLKKWSERTQKVRDIRKACINNTNITFSEENIEMLNAKVDAYLLACTTSKSTRNTTWTKLLIFLNGRWLTLIQEAAYANPIKAVQIIESCLYRAKGYSLPSKPGIKITTTVNPDELYLVVYVKPLLLEGTREVESMEYEYSLDNKNWKHVPNSYGVKSKFTAKGLPRKTTYYFRVRAHFTKDRNSDWVYAAPIYLP